MRLKKAFELYQPSPTQTSSIFARIKAEELVITRRKVVFSYGLALFSVLCLCGSAFWFYQEGLSTGFISSISLVLSDTAILFAHCWRDFLASVFETLPFASVLAFLFSVALTLISVRLLLIMNSLSSSSHIKKYA